MKHILLIFLLLLSACSSFKPGWINENSYEIESIEDNDSILPDDMGPVNGHFDEEGNWIPNDPEIAATYQIPDIGSGFIFDINSLDLSPSIQVELFEFNTNLHYIGRIKIDAGVAYQRAYIYVGKLWTSIFEISTGGFVGWNWEDNDISYGIGATIIRF